MPNTYLLISYVVVYSNSLWSVWTVDLTLYTTVTYLAIGDIITYGHVYDHPVQYSPITESLLKRLTRLIEYGIIPIVKH